MEVSNILVSEINFPLPSSLPLFVSLDEMVLSDLQTIKDKITYREMRTMLHCWLIVAEHKNILFAGRRKLA